MSKIKNDGLDQYGAEPYEQQQFGTAAALKEVKFAYSSAEITKPLFSLAFLSCFCRCHRSQNYAFLDPCDVIRDQSTSVCET